MECKDTLLLQIIGRYITNRYTGSLSFGNSLTINLTGGIPKNCNDPDKLKESFLLTSFKFSETPSSSGEDINYGALLFESLSGINESFIDHVPFFDWLYFKSADSRIPFDSEVNQSQLPANIIKGGRLSELYKGGRLFKATLLPLLYAIGIGRISSSYEGSLITTLDAYQSFIIKGVGSLLGPKMSDKLSDKITDLAATYPECVNITDIKNRLAAVNNAMDAVVSKTVTKRVKESALGKLDFKLRGDIEFLEK